MQAIQVQAIRTNNPLFTYEDGQHRLGRTEVSIIEE
jgi:hypothetical protein